MAQIRKFDPSNGEGIQKLVREALGETTRPLTPGESKAQDADEQSSDPQSVVTDVPAYPTFGTEGGSGGASGGSW